MGGIQNIIEFRERLNCKNVIVITGNHDHHFAKPKIRDLFTEVVPIKELIIEGIKVVLCHYPLNVWNESHKGSIHLFGHCHGSLPEMDWKGNLISDQFFPESEKAKRMDVGIDALYMRSLSYAPYSWERIKGIMSKRANLVADHHDSTTT
jgi:calcineurin-like phosphoesterase family protein